MNERFLDIFRGNPKERKAKATVNKLKNLPKLSTKNVRELEEAKGITRRAFVRQASILVGGSALLVSAGKLGLTLLSHDENESNPTISPEAYEDTYIEYLNGFESVVADDEEANRVLNFFRERRKRGYLKGVQVFPDEEGSADINFYTVIADPKRNPDAFNRMLGFAQYNTISSPTYLLLKKVPIDKRWAGVILAHEALHVYQLLHGIKQGRSDGFILGEQEAYEFEIRLLDRQTSGKLKEIAKRRAMDIVPNEYKVRLSSDDLKEFSSLFGPAKSIDEEGARIPVYIISLNYAAAESRAKSPEEAKQLKTEYIRGLFDGSIPILG